MNWKDINVFQYQQIVEAYKIEHPLDRIDRLIGIALGLTANQVDSLDVDGYNKAVVDIDFLNQEIQGKPVKYIQIGKKRYKCVYDVRKIHAARYIESKVFQTELYSNLHKLAASMVVPMKKTLLGWKEDNYDASRHEEYSQDMLEAKFVDVYHSIVFFLSCLQNMDRGFKGLFEDGDANEGSSGSGKGSSRFIEYYGWQYTTTLVAEYYRFTLNEAYQLPALEYLNALAYIKAHRDSLR